MSINGLNAAYSGMRINAIRQAVTANNMANINTDEFKSSGVAGADLGYINDIGRGVQVAGIYTNATTGPLAANAEGGATEQSNTDPAVEMTNMISARHAYSANVEMARTADDASQTLIDLVR